MSDDLQHGINEACSFFYGQYENEQQIEDLITNSKLLKSKSLIEKKLRVRDMNCLLMLGTGFLIAKGLLNYQGEQHYSVNVQGFRYYKLLVQNGGY